MAAHDFEDLLQCTLSCFKGLFPTSANNKIVQDLLFILGAWHGLAKLCMHTDTSLKVFGGVTKEAGCLLRHFVNTVCNNFNTEETLTEAAARVRQEERAFAKAKKEGKTPGGKQKKQTKMKKKFNLSTYKLHALGDYPWTIWNFGTTDSYSTQRVCGFLITSAFFDKLDRARWSTNVLSGFMDGQTSATLLVKLPLMSHARGVFTQFINASFWDPSHSNIGSHYPLRIQVNTIIFPALPILQWILRHLFVTIKMTWLLRYVSSYLDWALIKLSTIRTLFQS